MKLQKILLILPTAIVMATSASAVQINWGSAVGSDFRDSFGNSLNSNFAIQLGYFESVLGVQFVPDSSNIGEWSTHWKVLDQAAFNPEDGYFGSAAVIDSDGHSDSAFATLGVNFAEQDAYIWIYKPAIAGKDAESFLARSSTATGSGSVPGAVWRTPAKPANNCCDTDVVEWSISDLTPDDVPVYGKQGNTTGAGDYTATGTYTLQTFTVPEPCTLLLAALGGVVITFRRRRTAI